VKSEDQELFGDIKRKDSDGGGDEGEQNHLLTLVSQMREGRGEGDRPEARD